jgi:hypothetical protein
MSFVDNITPKIALETIGLRRDEAQMADLVVPVLVAFGLGFGFGAGAALLLAPSSGRELRQDLKVKANKIEQKLEQTVRKAIPTRARQEPVDNGHDLDYEGSNAS